ncbi:MAG TPA: LLM class flavin-dependent oxidoreductase [Acidimicrobiales bacterium]
MVRRGPHPPDPVDVDDLVTTNDPVKIAEDYATLQHLAGGRVDLMMGRGNTAPVYPWFGKDIRRAGRPRAARGEDARRRAPVPDGPTHADRVGTRAVAA